MPDDPVSPKYVEQMRAVISAVDDLFNEGKPQRDVGVVLLVFGLGDNPKGNRCNYMSNVGADNRANIAVMLKEMVDRWEVQKQHG